MVKTNKKPRPSRFKELFPEPEPEPKSKPDREIQFDDLNLQEWETDVARDLERKIIEWEKSDCPKSLHQDVECRILYFQWEEDDRKPRKVYRARFKRNSTIPGSIYTSDWEEDPLEALSDLLEKVKSGHESNPPNPPDISSSRNGIGTYETAKPQAGYCEETLPEIKRSKRDKRLEYLITEREKKVHPPVHKKGHKNDRKDAWVLWKQTLREDGQRVLAATLQRWDSWDEKIEDFETIATSNRNVKPREMLLDLYMQHSRNWPTTSVWQQRRERFLLSRWGLACLCMFTG